MSEMPTDTATSIEWRINDEGDGYEVRTYFAGGDCEVYRAGNHPDISDAYLAVADPRALDRHTLRRFARQTALERAAALGVSASLVFEER
jgi:hypothetical protein